MVRTRVAGGRNCRFAAFVCVLLLLFAVDVCASQIATLRNGFTIHFEYSRQMGGITRLYVDSAPDSGYVDVPSEDIVDVETEAPSPGAASAPVLRPGSSVHALVNAASRRYLVDADLIASVIRAESNFDVLALSPKGAQGLMQLMPATAARLGVQNSFAPDANIDGGSRYLRDLLVQYDGDVAKALAAYNAGPQRVRQYNGVPPYRETRAYVARVISDFNCRKQNRRTAPGCADHGRDAKSKDNPARNPAVSRARNLRVTHACATAATVGCPGSDKQNIR